MIEKIINKFWSNIEKTDTCWNWIGPLNRYGAPIFKIGTANKDEIEYSPKRISLEILGHILNSKLPVLTFCRNKICVNPNHLMHGNESRFWARVQKLDDENGCWIWTGNEDKNGYGKYTYKENGNTIYFRAHRYSWKLYTGREIPNNLLICHSCDNPRCVNPQHLFLGTSKDNMEDRNNKNRTAHGSKNPNSKLTEIQVKTIKDLLKNGTSIKEICNIYNMSHSAIYSISMGRTWKRII